MAEFCVVITTVEKREDADKLAAAAVERRLAACVQVVGPIESTFRWQGKIDTATEWQCQFKTRRDLFGR